MKRTTSECMDGMLPWLFVGALYCCWPASAFSATDAGTGSRRVWELNREDEELTPLMRAARDGRIKDVKSQIALGADVNEQERKFGATALMFAAAGGHLAVVQALLDAGADPNRTTDHNNSALMHAVAGGSLPIVELLVQRGADVNAVPIKESKDEPALGTATIYRRADIVRFLLRHDADVDVMDPWEEWTPIAIATLYCERDIVVSLIEYGADPSDTLHRSRYFSTFENYKDNFLVTAEAKCPAVAKIVRQAIQYRPQLKKQSLSSEYLVQRLYESRSLRLTKEGADIKRFLEACSNDELQLIRNAIFARKNYAFSTPKLSEHFERHFPTYKPMSTDVRLTKIDKENVAFITGIEKARGKGGGERKPVEVERATGT